MLSRANLICLGCCSYYDARVMCNDQKLWHCHFFYFFSELNRKWTNFFIFYLDTMIRVLFLVFKCKKKRSYIKRFQTGKYVLNKPKHVFLYIMNWKLWGDDIIISLICIFISTGQEMFLKTLWNLKSWKCHKCYSFFPEIKFDMFRIFPLMQYFHTVCYIVLWLQQSWQ